MGIIPHDSLSPSCSQQQKKKDFRFRELEVRKIHWGGEREEENGRCSDGSCDRLAE